MNDFLRTVENDVAAAVLELLATAELCRGQLLVLGCSTSEVKGENIGSAGSDEIAEVIVSTVKTLCEAQGIFLAVQCCEHLNRALVVEQQALALYNLEQVTVIPVAHAGGACAAYAMKAFAAPMVVEFVQAHAGLDIGNTLIGMHLKHVAVPVRLAQKQVGKAWITAALTRPKLIGGQRAVYNK